MTYSQGAGTRSADAHPADFYPTWPPVTRWLMQNEVFHTHLWDPACGDGAMAEVLKEPAWQVLLPNDRNPDNMPMRTVLATDLHDYGYDAAMTGVDFLSWPRDCSAERDIITNPPFKLATDFVKQALEITKPYKGRVAMFLRLAFLEGQKRGKWLPTTPLKNVYVMSRRVPMEKGKISETGKIRSMVAYAWFVWDWNYSDDIRLGFADWADACTDEEKVRYGVKGA